MKANESEKMQGKGIGNNKQHLFSISINVYLARYQLRSSLHNYGKCLENTIETEKEH